MRNMSRKWFCLLAVGSALAFNAGTVTAASAAPSGVGRKASLGQDGILPAGYRHYQDDVDDDEAPDDYGPPARSYGYAPPPAPYFDAPVYEWLPPPRPANCGEYRYWNGEYCADARYNPPYVGPRW